jgi:hypothetical protein
MKKRLLMAVVAVVFCVGTASAQSFWVGNVTPPPGVIANVMTLDWNSSGSGNARGYAPGPQNAGFAFDFLYQSNIVAFNDPTGTPIPAAGIPAGLNQSWEITFVAIINEVQLNNVGPFPQTAAFGTAGPGQWAMYYDDANIGGTQKSDTALGTGFNDGILIASGAWNVNQFNASFTATSPTTGFGSTVIVGPANVNPAYFTNLVPPITSIRLEGTLNLPPFESATVNFFDGNNGFPITPVGANDLLFKVDASSKFEVVPEPSTFLLLGVGVAGLAFIRRNAKKS